MGGKKGQIKREHANIKRWPKEMMRRRSQSTEIERERERERALTEKENKQTAIRQKRQLPQNHA